MLDKYIFKHKNGGVCEVCTPRAVEKLRQDKNYVEVKPETKQILKEEVKDDKKIIVKEK